MNNNLKTLKVVLEGDKSKLTSVTKSAVEDVRKMTSEINKEVQKAGEISAPRLAGSSGKLDNSTMAQIKRMNEMIRNMFRIPSMDAVKVAANNIGSYVREAQVAAGIRVPTEEWSEAEAGIERCSQSLDKLLEKEKQLKSSGADQKSKSWQSLQYDIQKTGKELEKLYEKERVMESNGTAGDENIVWKNLQKEILSTEKNMERLQEREAKMQALGADRENASWRKLQAEIAKASRELNEYHQERARLESNGGDTVLNVGSGASGKMRNILSTTKEIISRIPLIGRLSRASGKLFSSAFNGMHATLKKIGPAIKSAGGAFASLIQRFASGIPGITRAREAMRRFNGETKKNGSAFGLSLKTMLKYGLGIRSLFVLVNKLRSALTDGLANLANYSQNTNNSLSMLKSGLTQLKNSFATAFAPILNVVAPYLNLLIQKVTDAVSAIGMLFASLTGQKVFVRAKRVNQDYADSLKQNAASANAANEANQELQQTILGFDEINKLNDGATGAAGSTPDAGTAGLSPSDMFEEVPLEPQVSEFAKKLKDAWGKADFTEIGTIVGDKLNSALESIPWDKIQGTCNKIAKSVATFLNGSISETNWLLVGGTISQGINTAFETANTFATNFNWRSFGTAAGNGINGALRGLNWAKINTTAGNIAKGVVDSINSFLATADWNMIGETISNLFNAKLHVLYTVIDRFSWGSFGTSLGDLINGAVEGIDSDKLFGTMSKTLNGISRALNGFDRTVHWGTLSAKLYRGINGFLRDTNWEKLGESLSNLMKNLLSEIYTTIDGVDWELVGISIGEFLTGIDWKGILKSVAETIKAVARALPQIAVGLFDAIREGLQGLTADDWLDVAESLFTILTAALAIKAFVHGPKIAAAMLGNTIKNALQKPAKELGETVAQKAFDGFNPKWLGLLKAGVAAGIVVAVTHASTITTSNYEVAYPEDVSGIVTRVYAGKAQQGDVEKLQAKIDELRESLELLSDAGKENTEDFMGMSSWVSNLEDAIAEANGTTRNYRWTLDNIPEEVSTKTELDIKRAMDNANGYETCLVGIPSAVATTVKAETDEATRKVSVFKFLADKLGITKYKTKFEALTDSATSNIKTLTGEADLASGLKKILFEAQTKDADEKIKNTGTKVDGVKAKSKFALDVDTSAASSGLDLFTLLKLMVMRALLNMQLSLDTEDATETLNIFHQKLSGVMQEKTVKFSVDISDFKNINGTMYGIGQDAASAFKRGMKSIHIPTPHMYISSWSSHNMGSGGYSYTPNYSVQWYREGGPVSGEIWGMNESGNPEMIGKVGNKTAVANNEMITEAIKGAVVDGMMEVFMATRTGNGSGEEAPTIEVIVKTDDETLYRRVMKGKKKAERRYQVVTTT